MLTVTVCVSGADRVAGRAPHEGDSADPRPLIRTIVLVADMIFSRFFDGGPFLGVAWRGCLTRLAVRVQRMRSTITTL